MKQLKLLTQMIPEIFPGIRERDLGPYGYLKFPAFCPALKMKVKSYRLQGFGHIMCMDTSMMGIMKLSTFSFTPSENRSVPFLLVDTMSMGKKRLAYVEFYDCRKNKKEIPELTSLREKYAVIEDYKEKPGWYIAERMQGSLIKTASAEEEEMLVNMAEDALKRYAECIGNAGSDPLNREGLAAFAKRMLKEGNPSSGTLNMVLGKEKAADFFRKVVMPLEEN